MHNSSTPAPTTSSSLSAFAGIDVGKDSLELAITLADQKIIRHSLANSAPDHAKIVSLCRTYQVALVVLEATGGLELDVAAELAAAGIPVSVITPAQSRFFAGALNQKAKTDAIDASMLATFARCMPVKISLIASETQRNLHELATRRRQLTEIIAADEQLHLAVDRMDSIPGIGKTTATALIVACPELGTLNRQQIASLAGLAPYNQDSGKTNAPRHICGGRATMRTALYMATLAAICHNPAIKEFYQRLIQNGKLKMVALTAAMRKLLIIANSLVREGKTWQEFMPQYA